ncbi:MAG: hypothetical protein KAQ93_01230 [Spirochaetales bacterium]|nr:hypothetical protein [Spirochaetales bacterium]
MKKNVFIFLIIALLFIFSGTVSAQSRHLEDGIGGPGFEFSMGLIDYNLSTFGVSAAYSIGGIMDIGFYTNRETGTLYNFDRTDISVGFLYNLIVVKQTEYVPFSLQLEGSYGYTNVDSDYLTNTSQEREGQGFTIGVSLYNEISVFSNFGILLGGKGLYKNYIFTETIAGTERAEELKYGLISAVSLKLDNWPIIALGVEVLYSSPDPGISVIPSISIINPSY